MVSNSESRKINLYVRDGEDFNSTVDSVTV